MKHSRDSEELHWQKMVDDGLADFSIPLCVTSATDSTSVF